MFKGFKYLVIHKLKLAFGDVAKCGSSTIKELVLQYDYPDKCYKNKVSEDYFYKNIISRNEFFSHLNQVETEEGHKVRYVWGEFPSNYRKIIFVRNQFPRILSSYFHFKKPTVSHGLHEAVRDNDFETFLLNYIFSEKYFYDHHFKSMRYFLGRCHNGTEIYRFENFAETMKNIIQVDKIPHINDSGSSNYKDAYSLKAKLIMLELYKWDMINLNYDFNGITGDLPTLASLKKSIGDIFMVNRYNLEDYSKIIKPV